MTLLQQSSHTAIDLSSIEMEAVDLEGNMDVSSASRLHPHISRRSYATGPRIEVSISLAVRSRGDAVVEGLL